MSRLKANLVSVYVIREGPRGLEVLTLQRPKEFVFPGDWQVVHGHIDPGETAWRAAARELEEETALHARRWFRLSHLETFYNPENDTVYLVPTFVAEASPDVQCRISSEHQAAQWRRLTEARQVFSWETQRQSIDAIVAATQAWPQPGAGLMELDLDELQRRWERRLAEQQ